MPPVTPPKTPAGSAVPSSSRSHGNVKGTLLISRMSYLRSRGPEDLERVLRRLSSQDQQVVRGMLLPSSWYSGDLLLRLESTAAAILARGDRRQLFLDMGRFTADANLGPKGVQRPYLKEGDPLTLIRNVPRMYSAQHTIGVRTSEQTGPKSAFVRTITGDEPSADDCLTTVGWLKRALELSGARIVTVEEIRCRARGAQECEYACSWV
jgi:hypothetical protein